MYTHQIRGVKDAMQLMRDNLLVKHLAGSHAYGTALPTSDTDYRGIFCADPINLLTPFYTVKEVEDQSEEDTKYYELAHFMKLTLDCNPNVVETLWVDPYDVIDASDAYWYLREHRSEFLSSKIAFTTSGYALAQLKRIKGHNKWINNPQPVEPPRQIDFVSMVQNFTLQKVFKRDFKLEDHRNGRLIPYGQDIYGLVYNMRNQYLQENYETFSDDFTLNTVYDEEESSRTPNFVLKFNKEEYKLAKEKHKQYWTWKNNRNEARSELEEKFGYDTKHAMHLVRLLRMGKEALEEGVLKVKRPDAEELLAIRGGAWTYEQCVEYAEEMDELIRGELYKETSLPKKPNLQNAAEVLMEAQKLVWNE
jgi:predicted nucleotidyltransferase